MISCKSCVLGTVYSSHKGQALQSDSELQKCDVGRCTTHGHPQLNRYRSHGSSSMVPHWVDTEMLNAWERHPQLNRQRARRCRTNERMNLPRSTASCTRQVASGGNGSAPSHRPREKRFEVEKRQLRLRVWKEIVQNRLVVPKALHRRPQTFEFSACKNSFDFVTLQFALL